MCNSFGPLGLFYFPFPLLFENVILAVIVLALTYGQEPKSHDPYLGMVVDTSLNSLNSMPLAFQLIFHIRQFLAKKCDILQYV